MNNQSLSSDLRRYALAGAQARLIEIAQEADVIRRAFPELREGQGMRRSHSQEDSAEPSTPTRRRRGRRSMSTAQRKAVGVRMKEYWAARRSGSQATEAGSDSATATAAVARSAAKRGPRTMSSEARKRISDAQKARWAKQRGTAESTAPESPRTAAKARGRTAVKSTTRDANKRGTPRRSAAARKRMSEAQKKRWAAGKRATH
jgi:hypothetical protein